MLKPFQSLLCTDRLLSPPGPVSQSLHPALPVGLPKGCKISPFGTTSVNLAHRKGASVSGRLWFRLLLMDFLRAFLELAITIPKLTVNGYLYKVSDQLLRVYYTLISSLSVQNAERRGAIAPPPEREKGSALLISGQ